MQARRECWRCLDNPPLSSQRLGRSRGPTLAAAPQLDAALVRRSGRALQLASFCFACSQRRLLHRRCARRCPQTKAKHMVFLTTPIHRVIACACYNKKKKAGPPSPPSGGARRHRGAELSIAEQARLATFAVASLSTLRMPFVCSALSRGGGRMSSLVVGWQWRRKC